MGYGTKIDSIHARQVMDCKFRPVVEVDVTLKNGVVGRGAAPTGTSVGKHEAHVLRDNNPGRFCGLSVFNAIDNIHRVIAPALIGMDVTEQEAIDCRLIDLDGTANKSRLGGNATYSVSIACLLAAAKANNQDLYQYLAGGKLRTLPVPMANSIIGGRHPKRTVCFQEFTFIPYKANDVAEAIEIIVRVHQAIGELFTREQGGVPAERGNGHGWLPPMEDPEAIMELLAEAVKRCGYEDKVAYALDVAASEMYDPHTKTYLLNGTQVTAAEQISYLKRLTDKFNFLFIEDVLDQNDWDGYVQASKIMDRTLIVGDDLTVTNRKCLERAYNTGAVQGFVFKPNQVGTVTEAIAARQFAQQHNMLTIPPSEVQYHLDVVIDMGIGLEVEACKSCVPVGKAFML